MLSVSAAALTFLYGDNHLRRCGNNAQRTREQRRRTTDQADRHKLAPQGSLGRGYLPLFYWAADFRIWHKCEVPTASSNVRVRGQSGRHLLGTSISLFDPTETSTCQRYQSENSLRLFHIAPSGPVLSSSEPCGGMGPCGHAAYLLIIFLFWYRYGCWPVDVLTPGIEVKCPLSS
jgi:hypothetical protein